MEAALNPKQGQEVEVLRGDEWHPARVELVYTDKILVRFKAQPAMPEAPSSPETNAADGTAPPPVGSGPAAQAPGGKQSAAGSRAGQGSSGGRHVHGGAAGASGAGAGEGGRDPGWEQVGGDVG